MNYLQICQEVNTLTGMQGVFSSASGATGYQATLAKMVQNAWIDIQSLRNDWPFMRDSLTFNTVADQSEYTLTEMFGVGVTQDINVWVPNMVTYTTSGQLVPLKEVGYNYYNLMQISSQQSTAPSKFAIDPVDKHFYINPPDAVYSITAHYFTKPVTLSSNTDTPSLPSAYHKAIVYRAVADFSVFLGNPNNYQSYMQKADAMLGNILRTEYPPKWAKVKGIV